MSGAHNSSDPLLWIPDLRPGDVVERDRFPGERILIDNVYPRALWFCAVRATKENRPDRRFLGWSGGSHKDRFRLLFRPAEPRRWIHRGWHATVFREWDSGATWFLSTETKITEETA